MNARSLPNVTKTSVQMRSRLCPQERPANPSTPDLSLADDPWLPQKDLGAFELALSSALPGRSLFDPPLSPFVDYQDRAISPQRDKDVRLNNIAALPSGETSHSCNSFSVLGRDSLEKFSRLFASPARRVITQHDGTAARDFDCAAPFEVPQNARDCPKG
jgi:hypothetical protein